MKKLLKILGIVIGILFLFLLLSPFLFKGTFEDLLRKNINENLHANVTWGELDISLLKSFPKAAVVVKDFSVINKAPFEGDTLASGEELKLNMGVTQLLKSSGDAIEIDGLSLENASIYIEVDSLGQANYDIAKKDNTSVETSEETSTEREGFVFNLQQYSITDSKFIYKDAQSETLLVLDNINHEGKGDFSSAISNLDTQTDALVSLRLGDIEYLSTNTIALDAIFNMDFDNQKYTFLENEAKINDLPLTFNGYLQTKENSSELDLTFKTPSSDFKNFLAIIPKEYVQNLDGVTTTGDFAVNGMLKGIIDDERIPTMDIKVRSNNASFKYPNLPKTVSNISINADLKNETGFAKDTYLIIGDLVFKIDDELFAAKGSIRNLTENMLIDLALKGTIDLANIDKVLPIKNEPPLRGIFTADVTTNFDMASVENEQYQNIKTNGTARLQDFTYTDAAFKNPINIGNAAVSMSPGNIQLNEMSATTGQTDVNAKGTIRNLIPWIMAKQDLKGVFNIQSNTFNLNDFMSNEETSDGTASTAKGKVKNKTQSIKESTIQIPDFLDATLNFTANKVIYDDLILEKTKGSVTIENETASLRNVTSSMLGGDVAVSGNVSTQNSIPTFAMNLNLQRIDIGNSFQQLDILSFLAPIADALKGDLNTNLKLNGELNGDLTPKISTLAGDALAQIITAEVDKNKSPLLSKLGEQVKFLNLDKLSLQDVQTVFTFNNGNIEVKPFNFDVNGINMTVAGNHGLDKSINYNLVMDVPAKYMGSDITKLLAKLDPAEAENTTVAIPVGIQGSITKPAISVDTKTAVKTLTKQLIDKQKETIKDQGVDIIKDILGGGNGNAQDPTNTQQNGQTTTNVIKDVFGGLFGKKKKDSIN